MKITKRSWFFHLLGLLTLVLAFGVMLTGCDAGLLLIGGLVLGGIIGGVLGHVFIGIIVGGIIGCILILIVPDSSSSSSSSGPSFNASAWTESRKNDPHTCGNCTKYSSGKCRLSGNSKSVEDSCSNWD